nr:MAG TPA: hypothetical protein [Caudoviricetes sp.]
MGEHLQVKMSSQYSAKIKILDNICSSSYRYFNKELSKSLYQ